MKTTLKDKALAKYKDMKRTLGNRVASMERKVVRLDAKITARAKARGEQLAVSLDRAAKRVRRASSSTTVALTLAAMLGMTASCSDAASPINLSPTSPGAGPGNGSGGGVVGRGPSPIVLGTSSNYVILAKTATSNVPTSIITGNIGVSPAAASFITGFSLTLPPGGAASTSAQVTGSIYASDYAVPTPSNLTTAVSDMQTAYVNGTGRPTPDHLELGTGNIGGLTLPAGLYKWTNTVTIPTNVTLTGNANDVWIFQIAGGITQASAARVHLTGGALASNVFWVVAGIVDIGTTAHMQGQVLSQTAITLRTGATANGRLLAQTAVTLAGNTIVKM
jgi:uncharacterized membrane protein